MKDYSKLTAYPRQPKKETLTAQTAINATAHTTVATKSHRLYFLNIPYPTPNTAMS